MGPSGLSSDLRVAAVLERDPQPRAVLGNRSLRTRPAPTRSMKLPSSMEVISAHELKRANQPYNVGVSVAPPRSPPWRSGRGAAATPRNGTRRASADDESAERVRGQHRRAGAPVHVQAALPARIGETALLAENRCWIGSAVTPSRSTIR